MTRYQALRTIGCGCLASFVIDSLNKLFGVPKGEIRFMHIVVEYDTKGQP
jgi:hypothetical protein